MPLARAVHHDLQFRARPPSRVRQAFVGKRIHLGTPELGQDRATSITVETRSAAGVHSESHPSSPASSVTGSWQFLHQNLTLDSSDPAQLFGDHGGLHGSAGLEARVGVITATGPTWTGDGTHRLDPILRRRQDLHGIGPTERLTAILGDLGQHSLPGQTVPHEHHPAVVTSHTEPAVPRRSELHFDQKPGPTLAHLPTGGS